jgi:hypothetical protein
MGERVVNALLGFYRRGDLVLKQDPHEVGDPLSYEGLLEGLLGLVASIESAPEWKIRKPFHQDRALLTTDTQKSNIYLACLMRKLRRNLPVGQSALRPVELNPIYSHLLYPKGVNRKLEYCRY